ncbi:MAG: hypothetical protein PVI09_14455 [Anaerolineae bacterium]|jgi:hypothetical protein
MRCDALPRLRGYCRILPWEFAQNVPLVAGFLLGLGEWQNGRILLAVVWMSMGSILGSLIIWATEPRIVGGHHESMRSVLANVAVFLIMMVAIAAYLTAAWSHYTTDLFIGFITGALLGIAQDVVARAAIDIGHCIAMAVAVVVALLGIRLLAATVSLGLSVLIVTTLVTAAIVRIDYATAANGDLGVKTNGNQAI